MSASQLIHKLLGALASSRRQLERGANLIEYALLVALIATVCVAGVSALGEDVPDKFDSVSSHLT